MAVDPTTELVALDKSDPRIVVRNEHGFFQVTPATLDVTLRWWASTTVPVQVNGIWDRAQRSVADLQQAYEQVTGYEARDVTSVSELIVMLADLSVINGLPGEPDPPDKFSGPDHDTRHHDEAVWEDATRRHNI